MKIITTAFIVFSIVQLTACNQQSDSDVAEMKAELQQLKKQVQHLEDIQAIEKLQARYAHLLFTGHFDQIVECCYAHEHDEDVSVEFSDSGIYKGIDSVRALYDGFSVANKIPGFFIMHMSVDPYIEIASDGLSAHSHWLSPGATATPSHASWVWGPYYVDYVKEEGEWRILHSNLAPIFRTPYEKSWIATEDNGTVRGIVPVEPDGPPTVYRPYNELKKETNIFKNHPPLPEPY